VIGLHDCSEHRTDTRIDEVRKQSEVEEAMGQTAVARGWVVGLVGRWLVRLGEREREAD
jgi:hypothetical protein